MKTKFDEALTRQTFSRSLMPAEACSELGVTSARVRRVKWYARWLPALRRWIVERPSPHG